MFHLHADGDAINSNLYESQFFTTPGWLLLGDYSWSKRTNLLSLTVITESHGHGSRSRRNDEIFGLLTTTFSCKFFSFLQHFCSSSFVSWYKTTVFHGNSRLVQMFRYKTPCVSRYLTVSTECHPPFVFSTWFSCWYKTQCYTIPHG